MQTKTSEQICICTATKMAAGKFIELVKSVKEHVCPETLSKVIWLVAYTGSDANDLIDAQSVLDANGIVGKVVVMQYNFARCNNDLAQLRQMSKYILFLNDDVLFTEDCLTHCVDILETDTEGKIGTVGVKLLFPDQTIQHGGHMLYHDGCGNFMGVSHYLFKQPKDAMSNDIVTVGNTGAFLFVRRSDFDQIGGFPEYECCFEDCVFNWKMLISGKVNVTALSKSAIHFESTTRKQKMSNNDIFRLAQFFVDNSDKILQNEGLLSRTIVQMRRKD